MSLCGYSRGVSLGSLMTPQPIHPDAAASRATFFRQCDAALVSYLEPQEDDNAVRALTHLYDEFIRPAAQSVLVRLLRRGFSRDRAEIQQRMLEIEEATVGVSPSEIELPPDGTGTLADYWLRILRLSCRQRAALLLRTYPKQAEPLIFLFIDDQVATLEEAATAVGVSTSQLRRLQGGPSLADEAIAELMGVTAAQVRSYRQEARRRLQQAF